MEEVLDLFAEPYDPQRPVVCFDETSAQLPADVREPLPANPGRPRREGYGCLRAGTRNLFSQLRAPGRLASRGHYPTARREGLRPSDAVAGEQAYSAVPVIRVVLDNLNRHRVLFLYETFPAPEARRIAKRPEFHHTPKRGSWLNMAEIEFSVLARACLKGRNADEDALQRNISAFGAERNAAAATINWRFTAKDARAKLRRLYPGISTLTSYQRATGPLKIAARHFPESQTGIRE